MLKVLVVEDEPLARQGIILTINWAETDCVVVGEAANGEEGLEAVRRYNPGLIITDVRMPKMDGIEMVRRLREQGNDAYVIILTAHSDFAYAQSAVKLGAVDYLLKPFRDGDLEQAVARVQRLDRDRRVATAAPGLPDPRSDGSAKSKYVMSALDYIAAHYNDPEIGVSGVAAALQISESHLSHVFKKETAYTVAGYITSYRMHMAMQQLHDCRAKVYEVAENVGYRDIAYFSSAFKRAVGMSPSEYQKSRQ